MQSALDQEQVKAQNVEQNEKEEETQENTENEVVTTEDEKQAYYIVKSILAAAGKKPEEVLLKDYKQFCNLTYKNSWNVVLRLYFNKAPYKIAFIDKDETGKKTKELIDIESLGDIYKYSDRIKQMAESYEKEE